MTNGQNIARANHLENVANAAKRYTLREILDVTEAIAAEFVPFTGATSVSGGASGIIPAPNAGDEDKFLCGRGSWVGLPVANSVEAGLMSASDKAKLDAIVEETFTADEIHAIFATQ